MQLDREADVADVAGHVVADPHPGGVRSVEPVDAAVVLLVQAVGPLRVEADGVRVVAVLGVRVGQEVGRAPGVEGRPVVAAVDRLEHASAGEPDVEVVPVAGVDEHRVEHRAVGGALDVGPLRPLAPARVVVPAGHRRPGVAVVLAAEQALRRAAGVPGARLVGGPGREPEHRVEGAPVGVALGEGRGRRASLHVRPRSVERNTVGPRWPVRHAARRMAPSRGSSTTCWMMWPRNIGPAAAQVGARAVAGQEPGALPGADEELRSVEVGGHGVARRLPLGPAERRRRVDRLGHGPSVETARGSGPADGRERVALDRADRGAGLGDDHRPLPHDQRVER